MNLLLTSLTFSLLYSKIVSHPTEVCQVCSCKISLHNVAINCIQVIVPPLPWTIPSTNKSLLFHLELDNVSNFNWENIPKEVDTIMLRNMPVGDLKLNFLSNPTSLNLENCLVNNMNALKDMSNLLVLTMRNCSLQFPPPIHKNTRIVDLSNNFLTEIPLYSNVEQLSLDGNPIERFETSKCQPMQRISELSLTRTHMKEIPDDAFSCVLDELPIFINLSYNKLNLIQPNAFRKVRLSMIDLSHNQLSEIPETMLDWKNISYINLQFNPWHCDCETKWMVDVLIPHLYLRNPRLLMDFRCNSPSKRKNKELVFWYRNEKKPFCVEDLALIVFESNGIVLKFWTISSIASIILSCIIVILLIALIVVLCSPTRRQPKPSKPIINYQLISNKQTGV